MLTVGSLREKRENRLEFPSLRQNGSNHELQIVINSTKDRIIQIWSSRHVAIRIRGLIRRAYRPDVRAQREKISLNCRRKVFGHSSCSGLGSIMNMARDHGDLIGIFLFL